MVLSSIVSLSCTAFIFALKTILDGAMVVDMTGLIPDNLSLYAILDVIVALTPVSTTMTKGFTVQDKCRYADHPGRGRTGVAINC